MARGVEIAEFSQFAVFRSRCEIVHLHWPDLLLAPAGSVHVFIHLWYLLARLVYAKVRGAKVVWTVHNLHSHARAHPTLERWLWRWFLPLVNGSIHLSHSGRALALEKFPLLARKPSTVIRHGHYRDSYRNDIAAGEARARLGIREGLPVIGFVGQIRPYKNVPALIRAFGGLAQDATLLIAGAHDPSDLEFRTLVEQDTRIVTRFGMIPEEEMQIYLNACDLAVFPYKDILNSGSAILALSFSRPVLVPAKGAMAELQSVAGHDWVMTYEGELTAEILGEAVQWARPHARRERCDLSALDWDTIAEKTLCLYRELGPAVSKCP